MSELVFEVTQEADGGFEPASIRLHLVREEDLAQAH